MTSPVYVEQARVEFYKEQILKGKQPTAISLAILDVKEPAVWSDEDIKPKLTSHWCLAHYIIDGHHKVKAASDLNSQITLLSFIATEKGVSTLDDIKELMKHLD